jgi:hypothetical protein
LPGCRPVVHQDTYAGVLPISFALVGGGYGGEVDEFLSVAGGCHDDTIVLFMWERFACGDERVIHQGDVWVVLQRSSQVKLATG